MLETTTFLTSESVLVCKLQLSNSAETCLEWRSKLTEFDENTPHPAVVFMPEISETHLGGTMRLGSRPTIFQVDDCMTRRLYGGGAAQVDGATAIVARLIQI